MIKNTFLLTLMLMLIFTPYASTPCALSARASIVRMQQTPIPNAAPTGDDWQRLNRLPPGAKIQIETTANRQIKARFQGVTGNLLTISIDNRTLDLSRSDVRRVYRRERGRAGRGAVVGAGVGGATGATIGVISGAAPEGDDDGAAVIGGLLLGGIGIGVGALVGALVKGRSKKVLVYEVR